MTSNAFKLILFTVKSFLFYHSLQRHSYFCSPDMCMIGEERIASHGSTPAGTAIKWLEKHRGKTENFNKYNGL